MRAKQAQNEEEGGGADVSVDAGVADKHAESVESSSCAVMPSGAEEVSMRAFKSARNMPVPMPSELDARRRMAAQALTAGMRHGLSNHTWLSSSSSLSAGRTARVE